MDLQQLRTFVTVVIHGSFASAARQMNVAPSVVTRAVAALENELGVRLLQRTTRKLSLTEAGAGYFEEVQAALDDLDSAGDKARASTGGVAGTIRITCSVAFGQVMVAPLLAELHKLHPALNVDLLLTDAVVDLLTEQVDLALRLGPSQDSSLIGVQLAPVRYRVVASPAYLRQHGHPASPAHLANIDCLRFPLPGFKTRWLFRDRAGDTQTVPVKGWLVLSTALALRQAALDGLGPALLADWLIDRDIATGELVDLFPAHEVTATRFDSAVWLLYPSRSHVPRRVRAVLDFLKARLQGPPTNSKNLSALAM